MAIDEAIHSQASTVEAHAAPVAPPAAPAQLTEDQVDPLRSRAVQQELPGLTPAFDEQYMRSALQGVLFDAQRPRATIERCEVDQATYVPGEFVILRYTLALQDTSGGPAREALVSGRLFPSQAACEAYVAERLLPLVPEVAGREETAPFDRPVGMVADLHMAVHAWPIDGDLPALIGATDPRRLVPILGETLPALQGLPFAVDGCRVELVDYGRQHRATLRYHVRGRAGGAAEPRDLLVYGKVTGDGTGAMAETISSTLRERVGASATGYRFSVPLALLIGLTLYQRKQQAKIKRFATLHLIVIMTWASLWVITVMAGSYFYPGDLSWWLPAGIVTALPALIGAIVVYRATR